MKQTEKPSFPRFRGKGWYDTLEWAEFSGITLEGRVFTLPSVWPAAGASPPSPARPNIGAAKITRDHQGWAVGFSVELTAPETCLVKREPAVGLDGEISKPAPLSTGEPMLSLRAACKAAQELRRKHRVFAWCQRGNKRS